MEAQLLQEMILPIIASLAGTAFTAAQATKWYKRLIAGREERIAKYVEIGVRYAYGAYVRSKKKEGKLSEREAQTARGIALKAAGMEAQRSGDMKLLQRLSDADLNARLEATLQEIKADAAIGVPARLPAPPSTGQKSGAGIAKILLLTLGLAPLFFSGCAALGTVFEPPSTGPSYQESAIQAWIVWSRDRLSGELPDMDNRGMTEEEEAETAFRYAAAVVAYSVAQIQSRTPRPSIPDTLLEANVIAGWYLREAWPEVRIPWDQLQTQMNTNGLDRGRLAPLFAG